MKKNIFLTLVLFLFTGNLFAQSGWQWVYPYPTGNTITQVAFYNSKIGYAVGDICLLKTTNGGLNWVSKSDGVTSYKTLAIIDSNTVITARDGVFKTTDGGNNWVNINSTFNGVLQISFMNSNTGFAISSGVFYHQAYRTTNGGVNWSQITNGSLPQEYNNVICTPENIAYLIGRKSTGTAQYNAVILKTTDNGETWSESYSTPSFNSQYASFINSNTGYVIIGFQPDFTMLKTTNGGVNWSNTPLTNCPTFNNINFFEGGTGYGSPGSGIGFSKTTNEGQTWTSSPLPTNQGSNFFNGYLCFFNRDSGYVVGTDGCILKTQNGGLNWINENAPYGDSSNFFDMKFISNDTGFIIGANGLLLKSVNAGANWTFSKLGIYGLTSIFFNTPWGYIGGAAGRVYRTGNSGLSWDTLTIASPYQQLVSGISFISYNTGFASVSNNILKTTDAGISWQLSQGFTGNILGLQFFNDLLVGYAYTTNGNITNIQKTTNAGENWLNVSVVNRATNDLKFVNQNTGYIIGNNNISKTTNGGINWFVCCNFGGSFINVTSTNLIYTAGCKSTDGGTTWFTQTVPYHLPLSFLKNIEFINENTGVIVGASYNTSVIMRTTDGGGFNSIVNIAPINNTEADNFLLSQNYPNPFNPSTKINYEIKSSGFVSLKVFDLLGKEVAQLVNEKQNAGSYVVDFNSSEFNLPSGIYFYTLNAGEFKETRKMVLIK